MNKRWLIPAVVVVVVAGLIVWSMSRPDARLVVVTPARGTIRAYVEEQAITELPHDYLIAMPISGWLEPIGLREGDEVEGDQVVACLETSDLTDRVRQAEHRVAVLETNIKETQDHRLEQNALVEVRATVKALDETVAAAEAKLAAAKAVEEFAQFESDRIKRMKEADAAADREFRAAETERLRTEAETRSDALELAALKTLAAVSYIGPKFIEDYIDRKSFDVASYRAQLDEARAELDIARRNLERAQIKSPIAGVVLQRHQTRRQYLAAGTPLLTIGRLDDMEVTAEVLTERATRIGPGDPVDIGGEAIGDKPLAGKVLRVYPAGFKKISSLGVEQQRVKVAIQLERRPPELGVEFRVHVRIYYDQADDALIVPRTCLFRGDATRWQVMVVEDGVTRLQPVTVGIMNDEEAQIVEGLTTEDRIVARPSREIVPDMRVEIVSER